MKNFAIHLTNRPGELARVATALGRKDVNIKSVAGMTFGHQGLIQLIADHPEGAREALQENHIPFEEQEVVTVLLENRAGEVAEVASKLSNASVNLNAFYVIGLDGDLVELALVVDDVKKAKKALE
jgi:hypothetical protein